MISVDLFRDALIIPARDLSANKLFIVSGYATPAMVQTHISKLKEINLDIELHLIIGMAQLDAITYINHTAFQHLMQETYYNKFYCSYVRNLPRVHSKVYSWFKDDHPITGFVGSANYTQTAFISRVQREVLQKADPQLCKAYYEEIEVDSLYCTHDDASALVTSKKLHDSVEDGYLSVYNGVSEKIVVSFLNKREIVNPRSSLNWGHRDSRERNQAYIPLGSKVAKSDFFPPVGQHFTVLTDDNKVIIMVRAQQNGKALHTPQNNSLLGQYFRNRLGLKDGEFVTIDHLTRYGRSDVTFFKIDEETYFMDFATS